ncbi:MAG TPA: hypothetical protein VH561_13775 [Micromonosporaceae bacterium]
MRTLTDRLRRRIRAVHGDEGAQTVEIMLWVGAFIVIVGLVGAIFRDQLVAFFNGLNYSIGL